jgi:hypothetical protein
VPYSNLSLSGSNRVWSIFGMFSGLQLPSMHETTPNLNTFGFRCCSSGFLMSCWFRLTIYRSRTLFKQKQKHNQSPRVRVRQWINSTILSQNLPAFYTSLQILIRPLAPANYMGITTAVKDRKNPREAQLKNDPVIIAMAPE